MSYSNLIPLETFHGYCPNYDNGFLTVAIAFWVGVLIVVISWIMHYQNGTPIWLHQFSKVIAFSAIATVILYFVPKHDPLKCRTMVLVSLFIFLIGGYLTVCFHYELYSYFQKNPNKRWVKPIYNNKSKVQFFIIEYTFATLIFLLSISIAILSFYIQYEPVNYLGGFFAAGFDHIDPKFGWFIFLILLPFISGVVFARELAYHFLQRDEFGYVQILFSDEQVNWSTQSNYGEPQNKKLIFKDYISQIENKMQSECMVNSWK